MEGLQVTEGRLASGLRSFPWEACMEGSHRSRRWGVKAQVQVAGFGIRREMHVGAPPGMSVLAQWEPERAWHDAPA